MTNAIVNPYSAGAASSSKTVKQVAPVYRPPKSIEKGGVRRGW